MLALVPWSRSLAKTSWFTTSPRVIWSRYFSFRCTVAKESRSYLHAVLLMQFFCSNAAFSFCLVIQLIIKHIFL
jgi:hypothetical protein